MAHTRVIFLVPEPSVLDIQLKLITVSKSNTFYISKYEHIVVLVLISKLFHKYETISDVTEVLNLHTYIKVS